MSFQPNCSWKNEFHDTDVEISLSRHDIIAILSYAKSTAPALIISLKSQPPKQYSRYDAIQPDRKYKIWVEGNLKLRKTHSDHFQYTITFRSQQYHRTTDTACNKHLNSYSWFSYVWLLKYIHFIIAQHRTFCVVHFCADNFVTCTFSKTDFSIDHWSGTAKAKFALVYSDNNIRWI